METAKCSDRNGKNNLKSFKIINPAVEKTKADIGRQERREKQRE